MRISGKLPILQQRFQNSSFSCVTSVIYQSIRPNFMKQQQVERSILHTGRAKAYEHEGNYKAALTNHLIALSFHQKAFEENLTSVTIHKEIAHCCKKIGDEEKAKEHLKKASDISSKFGEKPNNGK